MSRLPVATLTLAAILVAVFAWQSRLDAYHDIRAVFALGLVPSPATLLTAQGLHGGFAHLFGNLAALLFAGPPAESRTGPLRLSAIFIVAGAVGLAVEAAATPTSTIPILGASASVAGLIGAVARRAPRAEVRVTIPARGFRLRRVAVPVLPLVAVWLVAQVAGLAFAAGEPVAFLAHATGFVVGALMAGSGGRGPNVVDLPHRR